MNEKSVEGKSCIDRESKSDELTIKLYSCHDINMKFLVVVTPPYIYHGCSTRKTFWEENFTGKEHLILSVNMKNCGRRKVRKHKEIKGSDILFRLSNFDEMSKLTYLSLPLISLCLLILRRPQFFMFTAENNVSSPVKFSSQNLFQVDQS